MNIFKKLKLLKHLVNKTTTFWCDRYGIWQFSTNVKDKKIIELIKEYINERDNDGRSI